MWHPAPRPGALPVRTTDRLEDLAAWLLTALGLLAVLGAVSVGHAAHDAALVPGRVDDEAPVRAVLLADVPQKDVSQKDVSQKDVSHKDAAGPNVPSAAPQRRQDVVARVPVSWTAADGTEQIGELLLRPRLRAGTEVVAWADHDGHLTTSPPRHSVEALAFGLGAGLTAAAGAWAVLTLLWAGLRRATTARNDAAWAREWAHVEPLWSRRVR